MLLRKNRLTAALCVISVVLTVGCSKNPADAKQRYLAEGNGYQAIFA